MIFLLVLLFAGAFVILLYAFIIIMFSKAWRNQSSCSAEGVALPFISVIIPFRNESGNLSELINCLKGQQYPADKFEVIAVDDHSADGSRDELFFSIGSSKNFTVISNKLTGKKEALKSGIYRAKGDLITTTDADCLPTKNWLLSIGRFYSATKAAMIIGPVKMNPDGSFLSSFQCLDYMALQMAGAGAAIIGNPIYCSGANLTFERDKWLNVQGTLSGKGTASGDDVFLLHSFKRDNLPISFLYDREGMVSTKTEKTLKGFLKQRMRWGGKSKSYTDIATILIAFVVLFANLHLLFSFYLSFFTLGYLLIFLISFIIKLVPDYLLIKCGSHFFDINSSPFLFLMFSIVYPFYLVFTALGGLFWNASWKGRK